MAMFFSSMCPFFPIHLLRRLVPLIIHQPFNSCLIYLHTHTHTFDPSVTALLPKTKIKIPLYFPVSDPGDQLRHGAELGLAGGV